MKFKILSVYNGKHARKTKKKQSLQKINILFIKYEHDLNTIYQTYHESFLYQIRFQIYNLLMKYQNQ